MSQLFWRALPAQIAFAFLTCLTCAHAQYPQAEAPEGGRDATTLSAVEVVGHLDSGDVSWHAGETSAAKTDLPLRELPQSVRVITQQTIEDLGAIRLDDVLDYVSGISRSNNYGGIWDGIVIRGMASSSSFGAETLLNGFASSRGFAGPRDLAGVERVEFLKGPAAALYGSGAPGGTLNTVSKRPLWRAAQRMDITVGSYDFKRFAADSSGPLGERVAYRLNVAVEDRGSFRDHISASREILVPALTWKMAGGTTLEYVGEIVHHKAPFDRGVVAVDGKLGAVPISRFLGEPGDGDTTIKSNTQQVILSHEWTRQWHSRFGLSWRKSSSSDFMSEPERLLANGDLVRYRYDREFDTNDLALQAELSGKLRSGQVEHEVLIGMEAYRFRQLMSFLRTPASELHIINIYHPIYTAREHLPVPTVLLARNPVRHTNAALYVQDVISISSHWRVMAGMRYDHAHQVGSSFGSNTRQSPSEVSPRLGVSWLPSTHWTWYANAGKSFQPNTGADIAGNSFAPQTGRSLETGVKWESTTRTLGLTAAVFDVRKRNVLTADPDNPGFSITAGEIMSRGLELDVAGQLATHWRLNVGLMLGENEVLRDNTLLEGARLLDVPRVSGSVLLMYQANAHNGQPWRVGMGVNHIGKRLGETRRRADVAAGIDAFSLPAYTTAKVMAAWDFSSAVRITLDVDNLLDRTHYVSGYGRTRIMPGAPRTFSAGIQANF